ncbi:MAG: hypothetical protein M3Q83_01120 [Pseudomonadota bacterium]|nr:hypothetical protein [Pseudomonadota bacterium]
MGFEAPKPVVAAIRDDEHDAFGDELPEPALRNPLAALTPASLTPIASPVHDQQAEIEDRLGGYTDDAGEEEEVDETAELYDPNAVEMDEDGEEEEAELEEVETAPLIQTKAARPAPAVIEPVAEPVAPKPVVELVAEPLAIKPVVEAVVLAPVVELVRPAVVSVAARSRQPRAAPGSKAKAAFTLRLDADRHLRLRLACAVTGRSAQQLVTDALDELLASMPELATMAERATKQRN